MTTFKSIREFLYEHVFLSTQTTFSGVRQSLLLATTQIVIQFVAFVEYK
jgi:hypothetical protein